MAAVTFNAAIGAKEFAAQTSCTARDTFAHCTMPRGATEIERARSAGPRENAQTVTTSPGCIFASLDPDIVSATIPAFFIGRNADGFWVARERNGAIGGMFFFESSALSFAHAQAGKAGCATIFPADRFELDIRNNGNRVVDFIAPLMRKAMRLCRGIG
jgi:hypothetical protein